MTVDETLQLAMQHHKAGRRGEAESLYRQVLARDPEHAQTLYMLGAFLHEQRDHTAAEPYLRKATQRDPNSPRAWYFLSLTLDALGQTGDAIAAMRQAVTVANDVALKDQFEDHLGRLLHADRQFAAAIAVYETLLATNPKRVHVLNNLGISYQSVGRFNEAVAALQDAAAISLHSNTRILNNLGNALKGAGRIDEAIDALRAAVRIEPKFAEAHFNLGNALLARGNIEPAIVAYEQALAVNPTHDAARSALADALATRGAALMQQGRLEEALREHRRALAIAPQHPVAHNNIANVLRDLSRWDEATSHYRSALAACPDDPTFLINYGSLLKDQGCLDQAIANFRLACAKDPRNQPAWSNLLYTLHFDPATTPEQLLAEHRVWDATCAAQLSPPAPMFLNAKDPQRRLRVGYVSPDFRDHVVGWNVLPLFKHHDRAHFEVYAYSDVSRPDALTNDFREHAAVWSDVAALSDDALAERIRRDEIDILVDLALHMTGNRMLCFARRPAPVQCTFAGYPSTTGHSSMQYRITDPYLDPPGENDAYYSETSIRLDRSFWCFDPLGHAPAVSPLPALHNGHVTFGNLGNFCKINRDVLQLWARVLHASPESRLMLLAEEGNHRQSTIGELQRCGVDSHRIRFVTRRKRAGFLELFNQVDLCLDTFPYNGHSTSLDAMWMGVPTVTLVGRSAVGRAGFSQLSNVGLPELAARAPDEFVHIAVGLANDQARLASIRSTLRDRMKASPLMDAAAFTQGVETAYRQMWRAFCE